MGNGNPAMFREIWRMRRGYPKVADDLIMAAQPDEATAIDEYDQTRGGGGRSAGHTS